MCGRFTLAADLSGFMKEFELELPEELSHPRLYNVAPSQPVLSLVSGPRIGFEVMEWGYVPSWAKEEGKFKPVINARGETVAEKPYFRGAFKSSRCAVLANGFYEWRKTPSGKVPYWISLNDEEVFGFAGLWSHRTFADGTERASCAIVTTEPNGLMSDIHNRMPVILKPDAIRLWLDREARPEELEGLITPYPDGEMKAREVSTQVNIPRNDSPENIAPVERLL